MKKKTGVLFVLVMVVAGGILAQDGGGSLLLSQVGNRNYNFTRALQQYRNDGTTARNAYDLVESDYNDNRKNGIPAPIGGYHENDIRKYQAQVRSIREETDRNGYTIQQSKWKLHGQESKIGQIYPSGV
jgi:hypothetical protein